MIKKSCIALSAMALILVGCDSSTTESTGTTKTSSEINPSAISLTPLAATGRWYSTEQVTQGRQLFAQYCAACHGEKAEATDQWKTPDAQGNYPPPPLNGSAHAWHHPLSVLDVVIRDGGAPVGGVMPAWGSVLNSEQRISIIAGFQHYWSDDIYETWLVRERSARGE
jgi:mono/diheme cytochrome c family protein